MGQRSYKDLTRILQITGTWKEGRWRETMVDCAGGRAGSIPGTTTVQARILPPAVLVSQISIQRKVNIYNILQEIIQQEGELEEQGVQRLVAIASKEMRETLEVVEPSPHPRNESRG